MRVYFILALLIFTAPTICYSQITGELIAKHCAMDAGATAGQYEKYGNDLAKTLSLLSPAQLKRVFGFETTVEVPETLNQQLGLGDINFEKGSPVLTTDALEELDKVAEFLSLNTDAEIIIEGHVQYEYGGSQELSEGRAAAARDYLISTGVSPDRIGSLGRGASQQLVNGDKSTPGTEINRRIEIRVIE